MLQAGLPCAPEEPSQVLLMKSAHPILFVYVLSVTCFRRALHLSAGTSKLVSKVGSPPDALCSHDVVLLCFSCHQVALTAAERLKREVSR